MRTRRWLLLPCVLVGIVAFAGRPNAQGPPPPTATLWGVGDVDNLLLADGFASQIRDAVKVGGVIYAVGGSVSRLTNCGVASGPPCNGMDTAVLWQSDQPGALQTLPDVVVNTGPIPNNTFINAADISADAAYIASSAWTATSGSPRAAVRVTRSPLANTNLFAMAPLPGILLASAVADDDPTILYGQLNVAPAAAVRIDTDTATSTPIPRVCTSISPGCPIVHNANSVAPRGSSADGNIAVGFSFNNTNGHRRAFRYRHDTGVSTPIPLLPNGTFNSALAVSPDGSKVLVTGNDGTSGNEFGVIFEEVYVYTVNPDNTYSIERLGSPNSFWAAGGRLCTNSLCTTINSAGGMTADGSVVAMNFGGPNVPGESSAYIHNANGWFHFKSVLTAKGVDWRAQGWGTGTGFRIIGMSSDGTLVYGDGVRNGRVEGFVAEFAPGALASFESDPEPPEDPSFVGAWTVCLTSCDPANPADVAVFTADGAYFHINARGFERGHYTYDGSELNVTTLTDTNGSQGLSSDNGFPTEITVNGNIATIVDDGTPMVAAHRIVGGPGSVVGGWVAGTPTVNNTHVIILFAGGAFFEAGEFPHDKGSQVGTYTYDPVTHEVVVTIPGEPPDSGNFAVPSPDERSLFIQGDDGEEFTAIRVIDPRTPAITSALTATATTGLPFAYQITGTNGPSTFGTFGFPPAGFPMGLNFNPATGLISGTPIQAGTFDIRLEASNTISTSTGVNRLSLTVIAPVVVPPGPAVVAPLPPEAPGEAPPITIEFTNVTTGGTVSVATVDPEAASAPDPPAGFSLGDDPVYYEITPSPGLTFTGPVEVCFSYAGVTFTGFPRLLHYDVALASWVDITLQPVDTVNQIVCGLTSSFSPFAIAASTQRAVGFHQPVEPVAGALNSAKGGSTVALKFNVYDAAGVEITNVSGIVNPNFVMSRFVCETGELEDEVPAVATGGTGLRYDTTARQFVQNWKTPKTPGCYLVKITGDGLLVNARFKLK